MKVSLAKIRLIPNLKPPINPKQVRSFLGYIGYYKMFIRHYLDITFPIDELLIGKFHSYGLRNVQTHLKHSRENSSNPLF